MKELAVCCLDPPFADPVLGRNVRAMDTVGAVLILDDDPDVLKAARVAIGPRATRVETLSAPGALAGALGPGDFEVLLLDMNFVLGDHSGRAGLDSLDQARACDPQLAVILMTAFGGVALAVEALKRGATDFILKPWRNEKLVEAVVAATAISRQRRADTTFTCLAQIEREAIEKALARFGGNISQAAAALGLTRPALYRRLDKHGL